MFDISDYAIKICQAIAVLEGMLVSEAAVRKCFAKYVFIKILQNSQEKACAGVSF